VHSLKQPNLFSRLSSAGGKLSLSFSLSLSLFLTFFPQIRKTLDISLAHRTLRLLFPTRLIRRRNMGLSNLHNTILSVKELEN
jgi:hypothetical protein